MLKISELNKVLEKNLNNFELATIISKRARQLVEGKDTLIKASEKDSNVTIATLEFAKNKFYAIYTNKKEENNT